MKKEERKGTNTITISPSVWKAAGRLRIDRSAVCEATLRQVIRLDKDVLPLLCYCLRCKRNTFSPSEMHVNIIDQPTSEVVGGYGFTSEDVAGLSDTWALLTIKCSRCTGIELREAAKQGTYGNEYHHIRGLEQPRVNRTQCRNGWVFKTATTAVFQDNDPSEEFLPYSAEYLLFDAGSYASDTLQEITPEYCRFVGGCLRPGAVLMDHVAAGEVMYELIMYEKEFVAEYERKHPPSKKELKELRERFGEEK